MFRVNLMEIEGEGDFPCPSCGEMISPDDETGLAYDIVNVKTQEDSSLKEVNLVCKKCGSTIQLEGFEALTGMDDLDELFGLKEYLTYPI